MITFSDLTPQELRDLARMMMEKKERDLTRTRAATGKSWPEGAQDRYNRQHAVVTVLNVEADRRELIAEARAWVADCQWEEGEFDPEWIDELTDDQVLDGIRAHYDGGLDQFRRDNERSRASVGIMTMRSGDHVREQPPAKTIWDRDARP